MTGNMFQDYLMQLCAATGRSVDIAETPTSLILDNMPLEVSDVLRDKAELWESAGVLHVQGGYTFLSAGNKDNADFVAVVSGEDGEAERIASVIGVSVANMRQFVSTKFDKGSFIKNILLDNVLMGDIIARSREINLEFSVERAVMLVRIKSDPERNALNILKRLCPDEDHDFVVRIDNHSIAVVKEFRGGAETSRIEDIAKNLLGTLMTEAMIIATVGIGTIVHDMQSLPRSYREAHIALEVGKVFDTDKPIVSYDNLGIGRLIYQLPTTMCRLFLDEVFKKDSLDSLDNETILTIQKFFENNLNVSETSRQLYVHRNTLVYRLDKVQKATGLDLRVFDHAIVFKVAMMVNKYLEANPNHI